MHSGLYYTSPIVAHYTSCAIYDYASFVVTHCTAVRYIMTVMCYIRSSNIDNSSASGSLRISGLPYAVAGSDNYTAVNVGYAINWSTAPAGGYTDLSRPRVATFKRCIMVEGPLPPPSTRHRGKLDMEHIRPITHLAIAQKNQ